MKHEITTLPHVPGHDHTDVRIGERGFGFRSLDPEDTRVRLTRCPECDRVNYAMAVSSGQCAWCGWDANPMNRPPETSEGYSV